MAYSAGDVPSVQLYSGVESQMAPNRAWETSGSANDWYKDDLILYDVTGSGSHPTVTVVASAVNEIDGIAMAAATGTTGTAFDVALLDINAIYKMYTDSASAPDPSLVGHGYDLDYTVGKQRCNTQSHTVDELYVVGINEDDYATNESAIYVRFSWEVFVGRA